MLIPNGVLSYSYLNNYLVLQAQNLDANLIFVEASVLYLEHSSTCKMDMKIFNLVQINYALLFLYTLYYLICDEGCSHTYI